MGQKHRFRLFFAWDYGREERWINRLSREKGLHLKSVGFCHYVLEEGRPGEYLYRLELLRRAAEDEAEKHYLAAIGAEEVCRNGDWGYYRIPAAAGPFAAYGCAASKLAYLKGLYPPYLLFGAMVYAALAVNLSALSLTGPALLRVAALAALTVLALGYTIGLTRFSLVLRRLRREAAEEGRLR